MKRTLLSIAISLIIANPAYCQNVQQNESAQSADAPLRLKNQAAASHPDRVSVNMGTSFVTQYISRGVSFSDQPSVQPYVTVQVALPELEGGAITDASVFVGSWNSIQFGEPGVGQANDGAIPGWYETDLYAGASVELDHRWTVSGTYYRYLSPADSFKGYNDLELIVSYDDTALWERTGLPNGFSLSPRVRMVQETGKPGGGDALYIEPRITVGMNVGDGDNPLHLAIPLAAGFSDTYYHAADGSTPAFGFFRTGVTLSGTPLPRTASSLRVSGGIDLWFPNGETLSGLDSTNIVAKLGLDWTL